MKFNERLIFLSVFGDGRVGRIDLGMARSLSRGKFDAVRKANRLVLRGVQGARPVIQVVWECLGDCFRGEDPFGELLSGVAVPVDVEPMVFELGFLLDDSIDMKLVARNLLQAYLPKSLSAGSFSLDAECIECSATVSEGRLRLTGRASIRLAKKCAPSADLSKYQRHFLSGNKPIQLRELVDILSNRDRFVYNTKYNFICLAEDEIRGYEKRAIAEIVNHYGFSKNGTWYSEDNIMEGLTQFLIDMLKSRYHRRAFMNFIKEYEGYTSDFYTEREIGVDYDYTRFQTTAGIVVPQDFDDVDSYFTNLRSLEFGVEFEYGLDFSHYGERTKKIFRKMICRGIRNPFGFVVHFILSQIRLDPLVYGDHDLHFVAEYARQFIN